MSCDVSVWFICMVACMSAHVHTLCSGTLQHTSHAIYPVYTICGTVSSQFQCRINLLSTWTPHSSPGGGVGRNSRIARRRVSDGAWKLTEYQQMMQARHTNVNQQLAMIIGSGQMSESITTSYELEGSGSMRQIKRTITSYMRC